MLCIWLPPWWVAVGQSAHPSTVYKNWPQWTSHHSAHRTYPEYDRQGQLRRVIWITVVWTNKKLSKDWYDGEIQGKISLWKLIHNIINIPRNVKTCHTLFIYSVTWLPSWGMWHYVERGVVTFWGTASIICHKVPLNHQYNSTEFS